MGYEMAIAQVWSNRSNYDLFLYVRRDQTDNANNRSSYAWQMRSRFRSGSNLTYALDNSNFNVNLGGEQWNFTGRLDHRGTPEIVLGSGSSGWKGHDGGGYLSFFVGGYCGNGSVFGTSNPTGTFYADRIPKPPSAPGKPSVSDIQTKGASFNWAQSNDNGSAIDQYLVRISKNSNPEAGPYKDYPGGYVTRVVTDLEPGQMYYVTIYARNGMGYSNRSEVVPFTTKSGVYYGDGGYIGCEILVGVNGSYAPGEVFFADAATETYLPAQ